MDPSTKDSNSCTNLLPSPNLNGYPFANLGLLTNIYNFGGLNTAKGICVSTLSICSPIDYKFPCVYYCCCYYSCKCYGLLIVSIKSSYMSPSISGCSSALINLVSCSLLTFCLYSLICLSCGNDICGTSTLCLSTHTNVGIGDGACEPWIIAQ
jgi:hypothetical protein